MNVQQLRTNETSKANPLIDDFADDVNAESRRVFDTEQYGWIAPRHFDSVIFGISITMVLFLIACFIAIAFYTIT
jgi:hypothetical protein